MELTSLKNWALHFFGKQKAPKPRPKREAIKPNTEAFYTASADWLYDKYHGQGVWLKRSIIANVIQSLLLILALIALIALIPLKQYVPYLYAFNTASGEVAKLGELEKTKLTADWQMTRYFLRQYIINRESFDYDNLEYPYQITWAMSDESIRVQYDHEVDSRSTSSPFSRYGKEQFATVEILSIGKLNENTAEIRFRKILQDRQLTKRQISHQAAIIKWVYVKPETTQKMLDRNPLGFKVTYYKVSQVEFDNAQ